MLSNVPVRLKKVSPDAINQEILRLAMIAELDAVNLYEQMAAMTTDDSIKSILLDVAKEEKTHVGEFQSLLLNYDIEQHRELKRGGEEVSEILGHQ